jgi:RNA polymerase sigma-70 factor (ECF subfamily)
MKQPQSTGESVSAAVERYADMVRRICCMYLKNREDVEDAFHDVFLKFFQNAGHFQDEQHEKAWLCRVTFNKCKDICKSYWRRNVVSLQDNDVPYESREQCELVQTIMELPFDQKEMIFLHYYEGWSIPEMAKLLHKNRNTIYSALRRAKENIRVKVGEV